jgi:DNA-binding MarR family transcriptional regulator
MKAPKPSIARLAKSSSTPSEPPSFPNIVAMDRTTLTAALKPLTRRGLVEATADPNDLRGRRLRLTSAGHALLLEALPIWKRIHAAVEAELQGMNADPFRTALLTVS